MNGYVQQNSKTTNFKCRHIRTEREREREKRERERERERRERERERERERVDPVDKRRATENGGVASSDRGSFTLRVLTLDF